MELRGERRSCTSQLQHVTVQTEGFFSALGPASYTDTSAQQSVFVDFCMCVHVKKKEKVPRSSVNSDRTGFKKLLTALQHFDCC